MITAQTTEELASRLRSAREVAGLNQDEVAARAGIGRSALVQIEQGNRKVSSLELVRLAQIYGRDIQDFFEPAFEDELVGVLLRTDTAQDLARAREGLRRCEKSVRTARLLEHLLEIDRTRTASPTYESTPPRTRWDAIRQGEQLAIAERRRLGLADGPLGDLESILEAQGVWVAAADLPQDISGATFVDPERVGVMIVVNCSNQSATRLRFSLAHEYCHTLADRGRRALLSRMSHSDDLVEARANSFAASFLLPEAAVREFVAMLGKGQGSRMKADAGFDSEEPVRAEARTPPGSQALQPYDVARLAHHFQASIPATYYRLLNLKLLDEADVAHLKTLSWSKIRASLRLPPDRADRDAAIPLDGRVIALALEAFRRDAISRKKLESLLRERDPKVDLDELLASVGISPGRELPLRPAGKK